MPFFNRAGRAIYFERHGSGPAIVFCHGAGSNIMTWWQQIPVFAQHYTCLGIDLRCFGRSHAPVAEFDLDTYVDDLIGLLDHCGIDRAVLVGQSLGGMVTLRVALRHPDRTAAWVNSDSSMAIDHPELMACVAAHLARASVQTLEQRALSAKFNREHPDKAFLYAQISAMNPSAHTIPVADWRARMQALNHPDVLVPTAQLTSLRCPTLFITGSADPILPGHIVREIAALVPGAACEFIDGAGHSAYFEQPAVFNHMLHTFLQQRVPGWAVATG